MHPDRKSIVSTTRGANVVTVFEILDNGMLSPGKVNPSGGSWPRTCAVDASGRFLYVGNQKNDEIAVFRLADGSAEDTGARISLPKVSCCRIVEC